MNIIGREKEQYLLQHCLESKRPEFLAVYGRRRTGKTYLIKEYFKNQFSFYATGVADHKTKMQLSVFFDTLKRLGCKESKCPRDWIEAFSMMRDVLESDNVKRDALTGKRVIFLDELPWMDTARSDLKTALDYFWNSWGASQADLLLIVCGSASSWIIDNVLSDKGGLYNRVTRSMQIKPFSLHECEELSVLNGLKMSRKQLIESYMIFGGIPYYLNMLDNRLSLAQNVDELLINENGELHYEYDRLFKSLFKKSEIHKKIIDALSQRRYGYSRTELLQETGLSSGKTFSDALSELEQCGFIRRYETAYSSKQGHIYQLIDPFTLFYHYFLKNKRISSWVKFINTPAYNAWCGNSFEMLCLNHVVQIKSALGISGVETKEYTWRSKTSTPGAQIDLLVDRNDDVINLCEMKYSSEEFVLDEDLSDDLIHKMETFQRETKTGKSIHITLVTTKGLKRNEYYDVVQNVINMDDLFK